MYNIKFVIKIVGRVRVVGGVYGTCFIKMFSLQLFIAVALLTFM
jgi:hypothetical protein